MMTAAIAMTACKSMGNEELGREPKAQLEDGPRETIAHFKRTLEL